ncbi:MATE family efflux transporter [Dysgonomonas macrotermitis]|uniref:Multidrug resistance protein, MATE family n=1 Tax=Dysgonomonas macrotermitis TaxID=1346286 RepID=A0A1M4TRX7_9BACT|nr:MATE family efflux transporter [Dysgonomonas macrotermitis]SHE47212.1 multidrug resistance protein, MATE family [Dysgonomonas macrotermitis]
MNRAILRLAIPNIISNITVPLLSMVDMAIVGHLDKEIFISAIAIAVIIFNFMYWSFSFLRMGTSGFTAQAYGAKDMGESGVILLRSLSIALLGGILIVAFQYPIFEIFFRVVNAEPQLKIYAADYFYIYVWAAPAVLGMYAFAGWFVGMQDARTPMMIAIAVNIINISMSLLFVYVLKMELKGVALGSTVAQFSGFLISFLIWFYKYKNIRVLLDFNRLKDRKAYIPFFRVNADIFIRTLLLIAVTTFFTSVSARMGALVLAANALLMQLFTLFSYIMDGFAYAAEALTGRFIGAKQFFKLNRMIKLIFLWGGCFVLLFTIGYALFTSSILGLLTDKADVIAICEQYRIWILIIPVAGFSAFLWDGIFIGATASRQMRNSMLVAAFCFFLIYFLLVPTLGNNALWLAFIVYLSMRGIIQAVLYYSKIRYTFT